MFQTSCANILRVIRVNCFEGWILTEKNNNDDCVRVTSLLCATHVRVCRQTVLTMVLDTCRTSCLLACLTTTRQLAALSERADGVRSSSVPAAPFAHRLARSHMVLAHASKQCNQSHYSVHSFSFFSSIFTYVPHGLTFL